ncbi:THAP domain-containing protein 1-like [Odontomachus brunneus]|uniref:THAP domain-containing protein 1-like n=1 Tax=Odontomachus brunneus TaxID=486640 RepID=UPI0013F2B028|nr:THAP domain-containing protein 1-like [Odontomachus brunneus]
MLDIINLIIHKTVDTFEGKSERRKGLIIKYILTMVKYCFINGCYSSTYKKKKEDKTNLVQFFRIPSNSVIKKQWLEAFIAAGHSKEHVVQIKKYSTICSRHFTRDCIEKIGLSCGRLKENSVPTIFPNTLSGNTASMAGIDKNISANTSFVQTDIRQREEISDETVSTKRICYAGDINVEKVGSMSPRVVAKSMNILKKTCEKKNIVIKRLRVQLHRQRRKIENLETLLNKLQTKGLFSSTSPDIVQTTAL